MTRVRSPELFLDVTRTLTRSSSGIESVVRNLSLQFGKSGLVVFQDQKYRSLTSNELSRLGFESNAAVEISDIDFQHNDILFLPELFAVTSDYLKFLEFLRDIGVHVIPFIHDLLPLENPGWFPSHILENFVKYADLVRSFGFTIANSERTLKTLQIWRRLGIASVGSHDEPTDLVIPLPFTNRDFICLLDENQFTTDQANLTILQVGNFDPRKNLAFTELLAKELAKDGYQITLNLVGANVWHIENWLQGLQLDNFPNLHVNTHLNLSDGQLELLWLQADLVFYFSHAEGFGLPVTEAVFRKIPTLANKDLPVMALCKSPHLWGVDIKDFKSTYSTLMNSIQHKDCAGVKPRLEGKFQLRKAWQKWAVTIVQELRILQSIKMSSERSGDYEN